MVSPSAHTGCPLSCHTSSDLAWAAPTHFVWRTFILLRYPQDHSGAPGSATIGRLRHMEQMQTHGGPRRRLSDKIEDAFDQACRQGQAEVAACMLKGLDQCLLGQPTPWERRQAALILLRTCAERLSLLRLAQARSETPSVPEGFLGHPNIQAADCMHTRV